MIYFYKKLYFKKMPRYEYKDGDYTGKEILTEKNTVKGKLQLQLVDV